MVSVGKLLGVLDPFNNKKNVLVEDQSTGDIIKAILNGHEKYRPEYKKISSFFKGDNNKQTAYNIWKFLKNNVKYIVESDSEQTIKSPAALLATGHCDCKNYSLFTAGILDSLNIPFAYRFASYNKYGSKIPGHVFCVVYPGTNHEIWIDAVLSKFDYHKPYTYKIDKKPNKMAIVAISGIGASRTVRKAKHAKRKAAGKTFGQRLKKGLKAVVKVAAAPVRNAFLLLVKLNVHNIAKKLAKAYSTHPQKVQHFWESAGGRIAVLVRNINQGKKKRKILGDDEVQGMVGIVFSIPAAITAAAPLLAKLAQLLKSIGIDPAELVDVAKNAINDRAKEAFATALAPEAAQEQMYSKEASQD
jgi:hypothetical protein